MRKHIKRGFQGTKSLVSKPGLPSMRQVALNPSDTGSEGRRIGKPLPLLRVGGVDIGSSPISGVLICIASHLCDFSKRS